VLATDRAMRRVVFSLASEFVEFEDAGAARFFRVSKNSLFCCVWRVDLFEVARPNTH